jgi:hypothetical protein
MSYIISDTLVPFVMANFLLPFTRWFYAFELLCVYIYFLQQWSIFLHVFAIHVHSALFWIAPEFHMHH